MNALTTALEARAETPKAKDVRELIERMKPELEKSLRSEEASAMLLRHYLTAVRLTPKLYECTGESLLAALLLSAQVRLEPGPLGHVYLVPFKSECVWILGYTGIIELARRSERIGALKASVVWDCDEYTGMVEKNGREQYELRRGPEDKRSERVCVVVSWDEKAGGKWFARALEVPASRVARARKASPAAKNNSGPWVTDETAMWAKTGIRAVRPWLPLTPEAGRAFASDDALAVGVETDSEGAAQPALVLSGGES